MDEAQSFVIVWNDAGYPRSLVYHDLAEGNSNDFETEQPRMLAYRREQLRATDRVVTDVLEAELLFGSATAEEPSRPAVGARVAWSHEPDGPDRRRKNAVGQ